VNPGMTFIYLSGAGTRRSGAKSMWSQVKGETESALLKLPLKAYMFRPGFIQPLHGVKSKTKAYRLVYALTAMFIPLLKWIFPGKITDTEQLGRAMLTIAKEGYPQNTLEAVDLSRFREGSEGEL